MFSPRVRRWLKRMVLGIIALVVGGYVALAAFLYVKQRDMIYPLGLVHQPQRPVAQYPNLTLWSRQLPDDQGQAQAYFWQAPSLKPGQKAGLVLYTHGNGDTAEDALIAAERYHRWGFHVLVPEYRGYARSGGQPTKVGIVEDVTHFLKLALAREDVDQGRVIFHGYSLGGGVACAVAAHHRPQAMILRSTFTGIKEIARGMGMPAFLVKDDYDNIGFVRGFDRPLLVIHGQNDPLLPFVFGEQLSQAAPDATLWAHQGDHVSVPDVELMWAQIESHVKPWR